MLSCASSALHGILSVLEPSRDWSFLFARLARVPSRTSGPKLRLPRYSATAMTTSLSLPAQRMKRMKDVQLVLLDEAGEMPAMADAKGSAGDVCVPHLRRFRRPFPDRPSFLHGNIRWYSACMSLSS